MKLFDGNCIISAEYDKEADGVNVKADGNTGDLLVLLTVLVDHFARVNHTSGEELAARICSAAGIMRRLTDKATIIDLGAIQRAKDKHDGD